MFLPSYNYMNYAQQAPNQPISPGVFNPYYPQRMDGKYRAPLAVDQRLGLNPRYLRSPLGILRTLLLATMGATVIASGLTRNRDLPNRRENSWNNSSWLSMLVFACVGFFILSLIYLMNLCNFVNVRGCRYCPWTILFAIFDLMWFPAMLVLGIFNAIREGKNRPNFRANSVNQGAFGVTSAFALLSSLLFLLSGIYGLMRKVAPKRRLTIRRTY